MKRAQPCIRVHKNEGRALPARTQPMINPEVRDAQIEALTDLLKDRRCPQSAAAAVMLCALTMMLGGMTLLAMKAF